MTTVAPTTYRLVHRARPWTLNAERRMHHQERARLVKEWRHAFAVLAREARIPPLERVAITAMPTQINRRGWPDTAACYPSVKAAVDGLIDASVLESDDPDHVVEIRFTAPAIGSHDALVLIVEVLR